jgi:hypothetical protein
MMSLQDILREARTLSPEDRRQLVKSLVDTLAEPQTISAAPKRSLREFRGIGASLYNETDAQAHVNQMRDEWDTRNSVQLK